MSSDYVLVWDLETVPDLDAARRMFALDGTTEEVVRSLIGTSFPKLPLHKIICIGALVASRAPNGWQIDALGAPHIGERSEADLIGAFVNRIGELRPQLVTFNGHSFDLPVLRYRAMIHRVSAQALHNRPYFHRYSDDAVDLCDALASFNRGSMVKLDELSKVLGLPGKPSGVDGSQVETMVSNGQIDEVARYCETDVLNTFRVWLIYELFRGTLTNSQVEWSESQILEFISARKAASQHLRAAVGLRPLQ